MLATQLLTPSVMNWDSNWYNLSRVPAMIIEHSEFPENSGVLWQALHPIAHDLLFLFDITLLSLRGMGLINSLELLVTLGCLYQLGLLMLAGCSSNQLGMKVQTSLLLITILFLSSDLQVLQSTEPKNDLTILMTFVINLLLCVHPSLRSKAPFLYLSSILLITIYAISAKGYGIVVLIPPLIAFAVDLWRPFSAQALSAYLNRLAKDGTTLFRENGVLFLFAMINMIFILFTFIHHMQLVRDSSVSIELAQMAADMSNVNGSISDRLTNFYLNTVRNAVAFVLYPYTTLTKINAIRPDDYILGFGPLSPIINDPRGVMNSSSIVREIKADAAFGSIFIVPLMIIASCLGLRSLMSHRPSGQSTSSTIVVIILSCWLVFAFFSYALLGQSFGSKYMGSFYVPLIPVISVFIGQFIVSKRKHLAAIVLVGSLYAITRCLFCFRFR